MAGIFIVAAVLASCPPEIEPLNVGIVEVNTVLNEEGYLRFTQVIFRERYGYIMAWRWANVIPVPKSPWVDFSFQEGKKFKRFAGWRIETTTMYDPEVDEQSVFPDYIRCGLK